MEVKCGTCAKAIEPGEDIVTLNDVAMHLRCFKCVSCSVVLRDGSFWPVARKSVPPAPPSSSVQRMCFKCVSVRQNASCNVCKKEIRTPSRLTIGGRSIHNHCCACSTCGKALDAVAYAFRSKLLCEEVFFFFFFFFFRTNRQHRESGRTGVGSVIRLVVMTEDVPIADSRAKVSKFVAESEERVSPTKAHIPPPMATDAKPAPAVSASPATPTSSSSSMSAPMTRISDSNERVEPVKPKFPPPKPKDDESVKHVESKHVESAKHGESAKLGESRSTRVGRMSLDERKERLTTSAGASLGARIKQISKDRETVSEDGGDGVEGSDERSGDEASPASPRRRKMTPSRPARRLSSNDKNGMRIRRSGGSGASGDEEDAPAARSPSKKSVLLKSNEKGFLGKSSRSPARIKRNDAVVRRRAAPSTGELELAMDLVLDASDMCWVCGSDFGNEVTMLRGSEDTLMHKRCCVCAECGSFLVSDSDPVTRVRVESGRVLCLPCGETVAASTSSSSNRRGTTGATGVGGLADLFNSPDAMPSASSALTASMSASASAGDHRGVDELYWEWAQGQAERLWPACTPSFGEWNLLADHGWRAELGDGTASPKDLEHRFVDGTVPYYSRFMAPHPHQLYFVAGESYAVLAIESTSLLSDSGGKQFRVMLFSTRGEERLVVRADAAKPNRLVALRDCHPLLHDPAGQLVRVKGEEDLRDALVKYETRLWKPKRKVGVLYVAPGQTTEDEFYSNDLPDTIPEFEAFLATLAEPVSLRGFSGYSGGLDTHDDSTGATTYYTKFASHEIAFHVAPILPSSDEDEQRVSKKKFLGNDVVMVIFKHPDAAPIDPTVFHSHFNHVFVVVEPVLSTEPLKLRVAIAYKHGTQPSLPVLPHPAVFTADQSFREFLLTKLLNSEAAAMSSQEFTSAVRKTRRMMLAEIFNDHAPKKILSKIKS